MIRSARWAWGLWALSTLSCSGRNLANNAPSPPPFEPKGESKCSVAKSQSEPLVVEWPSAARAKLESTARKGLVVVAYSGCEMRVLGQCKAPGGYAFSATTVKRDVVTMKDQDELYANVPVGAAKLEGKLASYGQLNVSMTIVGRYEAQKAFVDASQLEGACEGATHVVAALTTGAFKFFAGADAEVSGGVAVMGAGAGGKSASKSELLNQDGKESACDAATSSASAPPDGCGAILRVEVVPLGQPKAAAPTCPGGTSWDGSKCVGASVSCPSGSTWNGSACVGAATPAFVAPTPTPPAPPAPVATGSCPSGMASIPGGKYTLGETKQPAKVDPYCLDVTEVTVGAYAACVKAGKCSEPNPYKPKKDDWDQFCTWKHPWDLTTHPVNCVDWNQATAFCAWAGKRLPSVEEWEWAARGGDKGYTYPWGNEPPSASRLNACGSECPPNVKAKLGLEWTPMYSGNDGHPETASVGSFPATTFGLRDMAGNVWEWTSSNFDASKRVTRGGGWSNSGAAWVSASHRSDNAPSNRNNALGFRCARTDG